jgi:putative transposase
MSLQTQCVQMFNHRHRRSGTLWEGRFRSCLVSTDDYLLRVYRYIERNPVSVPFPFLSQHFIQP